MADVEDVSETPSEIPEAREEFIEGLYLGDAIRFFLDSKRAGGRSGRTLSEYRKKLDLFQSGLTLDERTISAYATAASSSIACS